MEYYKTKYEGYCVTKNGTVLSFRKPAAKSAPEKRVDYTRAPKVLSAKIDKDGYLEICLSVNCTRIYKKVHQLICEVFHGARPSDGFVVDHINRNRQDNRPENLRWLHVSENSDGWKGKKTKACKKCLYNNVLYHSIKDACRSIGMEYSYYARHHSEISHVVLFEGVETIEIRKVSRVGRKWLPIEARTTDDCQ